MSGEKATILLTGATGFVGGKLLTALAEQGRVRCLVRDASRLERLPGAEPVQADLEEIESLRPALEGIDEVYYLVHSMERAAGADYADRARRAAEQLAAAQDDAARREVAAAERTRAELAAAAEARELMAETRSTGAALRGLTGQGPE